MIFSLAIDSDNYKFCFFNCIFVNRWQLAVNLAQCLLSRISPATRLLSNRCLLSFLSLFFAYNLPLLSARPLLRTLLRRAERSRTTRIFASGCQCLSRSEFHYTMLGVDGASGQAVCETKEQEIRCNAGQEPQASAAAPPPPPTRCSCCH